MPTTVDPDTGIKTCTEGGITYTVQPCGCCAGGTQTTCQDALCTDSTVFPDCFCSTYPCGGDTGIRCMSDATASCPTVALPCPGSYGSGYIGGSFVLGWPPCHLVKTDVSKWEGSGVADGVSYSLVVKCRRGQMIAQVLIGTRKWEANLVRYSVEGATCRTGCIGVDEHGFGLIGDVCDPADLSVLPPSRYLTFAPCDSMLPTGYPIYSHSPGCNYVETACCGNWWAECPTCYTITFSHVGSAPFDQGSICNYLDGVTVTVTKVVGGSGEYEGYSGTATIAGTPTTIAFNGSLAGGCGCVSLGCTTPGTGGCACPNPAGLPTNPGSGCLNWFTQGCALTRDCSVPTWSGRLNGGGIGGYWCGGTVESGPFQNYITWTATPCGLSSSGTSSASGVGMAAVNEYTQPQPSSSGRPVDDGERYKAQLRSRKPITLGCGCGKPPASRPGR